MKQIDDSQPAGWEPQSAIPRPPHILTITPFYPVEGDDARGCFIAESVAALNLLRVQNTVIGVQPFYRGKVRSSQSSPPASWRSFVAFPGGYGLSSAGVFLFSALLASVREFHRQNPIDVIHAHAALPCGHAAALLSRELKIPFVVSVHGLDAFFTNQVNGYAGSLCKRVCRWVYRSAARTICISEKVRDCVLQNATANTVVVYNGVDPNLFADPESDGQNSILSVGNLIPIKGHELLLRGFAAIRERFPKLECDIIGQGPERARLESLTRELKISHRVRFHGKRTRTEVAAAMAQCTLFALPSRYEGLGCVYLEAMATAKPVIGCAGQGIEEVIAHGRNGWLIQPDSLPEMTDALADLLSNADRRYRIGQEARRTVLAGFTLAHQADMLLHVYQGCMA